MAKGIIFFEKNKLDIENVNATITVTDAVAIDNGQANVDFMRNRNNNSAWLTTGSTDAANTQLDINLGEPRFITDIIMILNNFDAYTIQFKSGLSFIDFSTPINVSANAKTTNRHQFNKVSAQEIRIIITGTTVPDADKIMRQLIITDLFGQLTGFPQVKSPKLGQNIRLNKLLSGKVHKVKNIGAFSCTLSVQHWKIQADIDIISRLYFSNDGVLMWINADNPGQFFLEIEGYKRENIFLISPADEFTPEFVKGVYVLGIKQAIKLVEVIS